jgi:hypothetical protein
MSIILGNGGAASELQVEDGAARVVLHDGDGNRLAIVDGAAATVDQGLPIMGRSGGAMRILRTGHTGGLALNRVSLPVFQETGDGAAVNTQLWAQVATTMAATLANRVTTLNSGSSIAAAVGITHRSLAQITKSREGLLRLSSRFRFSWQAAGAVMQVGFGIESTAIAEQLVNGITLQVNASGAINIVTTAASTDTPIATGVTIGTGAGQVNPAHWYDLDLYLGDDFARVILLRANQSTDELPVIDVTLGYTNTQAINSAVRGLPIIARILNASAPSIASQLMYTTVEALTQDVDQLMRPEDSYALCGRGGLITIAGAPAQLANYANSAAPVSATLSNTAAGYTTPDGQFQFAAPVGAETDFALFAFTVPTSSRMIVKGISIHAMNVGAAVATTATVLQWACDRAAAVTLASNSFRKALGIQTFPVAAAIGTVAAPIVERFDVPIVIESGQTWHVMLKVPVGTATASQIIRGVVRVDFATT